MHHFTYNFTYWFSAVENLSVVENIDQKKPYTLLGNLLSRLCAFHQMILSFFEVFTLKKYKAYRTFTIKPRTIRFCSACTFLLNTGNK